MGFDGWVRSKTPLDRIGSAEEVADAVLFLVSDLSRFVTGHHLVVDGGVSLHGSGIDGVLAEVTRVLTERAVEQVPA